MRVTTFLIYLIDFVLAIVELLIGMRILLKLFAANANAPFVAWIYETSRSLIWPFLGMFPAPTLEGGVVVEFSAIFALIVYAIIGFLLVNLIEYIAYVSSNTYRRVVVTKTVKA
jgi:hypothetical protein